MTGEKLTLDELYVIQTAGGRNSGERSTALPARAYGDPSNITEFPAERQRRLKKAKKSKQKLKLKGNR